MLSKLQLNFQIVFKVLNGAAVGVVGVLGNVGVVGVVVVAADVVGGVSAVIHIRKFN